jgi:selenophosphate synthase
MEVERNANPGKNIFHIYWKYFLLPIFTEISTLGSIFTANPSIYAILTAISQVAAIFIDILQYIAIFYWSNNIAIHCSD